MLKKIKEKGWKQVYGAVMKFWGAGYGVLVGKFYGIINLILLISVYFISKGFDLGFVETIIFGVAGVSIIFIAGIIYVRMDLLKAESQSYFVENPQQLEMYYRIQRIEAKLDQLLLEPEQHKKF